MHVGGNHNRFHGLLRKGMFADDSPNSDMPATERIPAVLMENYLGKEHTLYTDNFYTSPTLAPYFLKNKTHLVGTMRSNRYNYSKDIVTVNLEKGKASFYLQEQDPMIAIKYRSHKDKVPSPSAGDGTNFT